MVPHERRCRGNEARGRVLRLTFDGREVLAYEGETVAAALLAAGHGVLRLTSRRHEPCGYFCGIGVCFQCLVQIDGRPNAQACRIPVAEGMRVQTQQGIGSLEPSP